MDDIDIFEPDALDRSVEAYEDLPLPAQIAAGFTPAGLAADVATAAKYGRDAVRQLVAGKYGEAAAPAILAALAGVGLIPVVGDIAKKYGSRAVKDSFQPKGRVLGDVYDQELGGYTGQELIKKYNLNPNLSEADAYADLARRYQADKGQNPNLTHMMPRPKGSDDSVKSRIAAGQTSSGLDTRIHQEGDEYFTVDGSNIFKGNMKHKYFEYQLDPDTIPPNTKVERLQTVEGKPQKIGEFVHKPSLQGMADGGAVENIDIFSEPERDMMGVPITGSSRDRQLEAFRGMARQRYVDPVENRAKDMIKMQVVEALSNVPGIKGEAISSIVALADSQNPDDKLAFNQIVSRLELPVDLRRMGSDYMASKRFENVLGDNSSVGVSAYLPDEGKKQYSLSAEKRFPNFLGGEARVGGNISTGGDPEIRASFMKRFANGGDVDIFSEESMFRDPVYEDLGYTFDPERNEYFEIIDHPEYGRVRSYIQPSDIANQIFQGRRYGLVTELDDSPYSKPGDLAFQRRMDLMAERAEKRREEKAARSAERMSPEERKRREKQAEDAFEKSGMVIQLQKGRGYKEGGGVGDIDIFEPSNPAPPARAEYIPPQRFDQLQQFAEDPQGFSSNEAVVTRYEQGRQDILSKREQGGYGVGDNFDLEAFRQDYQNLNKALDMGMPARIFPAFTPYTAREADMAAEITQYEGVPTPEQQAAEQVLARTSADRALERKITDLDPFGRRVQEIAGGVGSLLGRLGGTSDEKQFILREEAKGPEIKLFRQEARRGMPSQTGVTFTRRF